MVINEMTANECGALLARASLGRLGCSLDNQPYVVPIRFAYEADDIYALSTLGQKIEWMRANPKVCLEVDEIENQSQWMSVIATGLYHWWQDALAERQLKLGDDSVAPLFFRIHIDSISGLRAVDESASGKDSQG
jgi:nitroimidazol reductase NimA-like FMN-containing flavoprotein (pyridoxamine 5'-phosphate oxidase superfamily)